MEKKNITIVMPKTDINAELKILADDPKKQLIACITASLFTKIDIFNLLITKCTSEYIDNQRVVETLKIFKPHVNSPASGDGGNLNMDRFFTYITSVLFFSTVIKPILIFIDNADICKKLGVNKKDYLTQDDSVWFMSNILSGRDVSNQNIAIAIIEVLKKLTPIFTEINQLVDNKGICVPIQKDAVVSLVVLSPDDKITKALAEFIKTVKAI